MDSSKILLLLISLICAFAPIVLSQDTNRGDGKRVLMGFKETPTGSNFTFECSPSGPCVACPYSEKRDDQYRCSETGYRIPLKCVELESGKKEANGEKGNRRFSSPENYNSEIKSDGTMPRSLLAVTSKSDHKSQAYITYRSCVPAVNEEKLSMLGFEGIVLILLSMSGSFIYFRRKQNDSLSGNGAVRFQLVFRGIVLILLSMSSSVIYFRWKQNNSPSGNGDGIVLILLSMSSSFIYFRWKQNNSPSGNGAVRFQFLMGIVLILLSMSSSFIYFRWKHNNSP